jgi:2-polyprenyl-6-methoxyphenol hydroxylase-like FAD-dependent oxidoreductase
MIKTENAQWTISMGGMLGDHPTVTDAGLLEFARGLPTPEIYEFMRTAEPVSEIIPYHYPASVWRRYDELVQFPAGILPLGDAIASFNPVYGQGMTVAALEALALRDCLEDGIENVASRYSARVARLISVPWQIAAGSDLRNPGVCGRRTIRIRLANIYLNRVHQAAHRDGRVAVAFHRVSNLLAPPATLLHPCVLSRVLWQSRKNGGLVGFPTRPPVGRSL